MFTNWTSSISTKHTHSTTKVNTLS